MLQIFNENLESLKLYSFKEVEEKIDFLVKQLELNSFR